MHVCRALRIVFSIVDNQMQWNPCVFGDRVFHPEFRYSCQHAHSLDLHTCSHTYFTDTRDAPLPSIFHNIYIHRLWESIDPLGRCDSSVSFHCGCGVFLPVRWYAFHGGWLLPSPPSGCHEHTHVLHHSESSWRPYQTVWALPLLTLDLRTQGLTAHIWHICLQSCSHSSKALGPPL